ARTVAERHSDAGTIAGAENVIGSAKLVAGDEEGRGHLERSLQIAGESGLDGAVAVAYTNLGSAYGEVYQFARADRYLAEGVAFCAERDLDHGRLYMLAWQALSHLYQGRWSEATAAAQQVLATPSAATISRIMALVALGRVRVRRGDPE